MSVLRRAPMFLVLVVAGCVAGGAGEVSVPTEPLTLPGGVQNPSAADYFRYGERVFETNPQKAAEAFYWSMRRNPTWATPIYARRLALFLDDDYLFSRYLSRSKSALTSPVVQQLDSLYLRALKLNPFLERRLYSRALRKLWRDEVSRDIRRRYPSASVTDMEISHALLQLIREASADVRAYLAHSEGRYGEAASLYDHAIRESTRPAELHAEMGRVLFMLGRYGEAIDQLRHAMNQLRAREQDELQRMYSSKAVYLHGIGLIHETHGDTAAARDTYAEALQEDLSYHPAHVRLAELALATNDTATALNEMRLAAEISPDEAVVLVSYARLLTAVGELAEAEAAYRHLNEVEPYFASPFLELAQLLDSQERPADAAEAYRAYLERAPDGARAIEAVRERLDVIVRSTASDRGTSAESGGGW